MPLAKSDETKYLRLYSLRCKDEGQKTIVGMNAKCKKCFIFFVLILGNQEFFVVNYMTKTTVQF